MSDPRMHSSASGLAHGLLTSRPRSVTAAQSTLPPYTERNLTWSGGGGGVVRIRGMCLPRSALTPARTARYRPRTGGSTLTLHTSSGPLRWKKATGRGLSAGQLERRTSSCAAAATGEATRRPGTARGYEQGRTWYCSSE